MEATMPGSIQRQLDQAAAIEQELYGQAAAPEMGNTAEPAAEPVAPVVPQAEQPAEIVATPVTPPAHTDEVWEQKFNVLRGKYEAEVPRLHGQVRELTEQLQAMQTRLDKPAPQPAPVAPPAFTEADEEKFGSDLLDAMSRIANAAAVSETTKARQEVDQKVTSAVKPVADALEQNNTARFWGAVDTAVPDFEQTNQDPRWFQYLDTRIPGTQMTRRDAANAAIARYDAASLIELVQTWKQAVTPAPTPPVAAPTQAQTDLSRQVAPTTRRDTAQAPPAGRIWTGDEYAAAQDPRNAHHMPKAEYEKLVADSELALAEGRIKW